MNEKNEAIKRSIEELKKRSIEELKKLFLYRNYQFVLVLLWLFLIHYISNLDCLSTFELLITAIVSLIGFQKALFWWLR